MNTMKVSLLKFLLSPEEFSEYTASQKKRRRTAAGTPILACAWYLLLTFSLIVPAVLILTYYGYCFGFWGRTSLRLQYHFQCKCPVASEERRYSEEVEIIISACHNGGARLSPSGRLLYINETTSGSATTYLLDLQTHEKLPFSLPESQFYFLTDDLLYVFVYYAGDEYIFDRTTNTMYPINHWFARSDAYINGSPNLTKLTESLREAKNVYFVDDQNLIVALSKDFPASPDDSFLSSAIDIHESGTTELEKFFHDNGIVYQTVLANYPHESVSPNGKLIARDKGIYIVETNERIAEAPPSLVRGWTSDGRGAIYSSPRGLCLTWTFSPFADEAGCVTWVPQPVILLKVPEEYLLPQETP